MYNQFIKNLNYFIDLNSGEGAPEHCRLALAMDLKPLTSPARFYALKIDNATHFAELSNLLAAMKDSVEQYPSFETLVWELWAMGFDAAERAEIDERCLEQMRMVDLLLSTLYWAEGD